MVRAAPFVLVVDAYPDAAESTRELLSLCGFDASTAGSCAEALATARDHLPAAVVTSEELPDGSGRKLAERMRGLARPVPAVIAIGDGRHPPAFTSFDHYFAKPADPRQLVNAVRRCLADVVPVLV